MQNTKWIFVTGGVLSGLGKGLVSASIGKLLQAECYNVIPIKCDGYLNVDPGTMNPIEHGEIFVLRDGGEVDMDFGHYERFLGVSGKFKWNLTSGKIFQSVIEKERSGEYLGKTVQIIPHVTDEIKDRFEKISEEGDANVVIVEVGGTVGDIENLIFLEAIRQLRSEMPKDDTCLIHTTLVPWLKTVGEQKTKPTQHSVKKLQELGLSADVIVGRGENKPNDKTKDKISMFCNVPKENVTSNPDVDEVYEIPLVLKKEGLGKVVNSKLEIGRRKRDLQNWEKLVNNLKNPNKEISIAICGKYTKLEDSYVSIKETLKHCSAHLKCKTKLKFIETTQIENYKKNVRKVLEGVDGVIIPGGFGSRGIEGKVQVAKYCRENRIPILGLCLGLQIMTVEFARNVCGLEEANSTEVNKKTEHPVIDLLPEQRDIEERGGTMRLGAQKTKLKKGSLAKKIYESNTIEERFRHRYEINPKYHKTLKEGGLIFSGKSKEMKDIMQIIELDEHPFYFGTQFHPEFTSRFEEPNPVFKRFTNACVES